MINRRNLVQQALVAPATALALPRPPRGPIVAPQAPLPQNIRFGPVSPGQVTSSRFSGGVSPGPINPVHPAAPPVFQAPTYAPLALMAALAATGVGAPAPGHFNGVAPGEGNAGAVTASPPPPRRCLRPAR